MSRHTCATTLLNNDVPIAFVAKTLGHKDIRTTQHYSKVLNEALKEKMIEIKDKI
jgi:site-specific recombinase XerD